MPTIRRPDPAEVRAAREARRLRAAELFALGRTQAEVARDLGVSRQSAHVWHTRFQEGGVDALRSRGPTGPDPKLSAAVSTVDNVPTPAGQISTVLALGREGAGTSGKYGTEDDAQPVPPVPAATR